MRNRRIRKLAGLVAIVAITSLIVSSSLDHQRGKTIDGDAVILSQVHYGTNHLAPQPPFSDLARRLPAHWKDKVGWRPGDSKPHNSSNPIFSFWLKFATQELDPTKLLYTIADENGFEAIIKYEGFYGTYTPGGFATDHTGHIFGTSIVPRHSRKFFLRVYQPDDNDVYRRATEFSIKNKVFEDHREWTSNQIATTATDRTFTLISAKVGVDRPNPLERTQFPEIGQWAELRFQIKRDNLPMTGWTINELWIYEETGYRIRVSGQSRTAFDGRLSWIEDDEIVCLFRWPFWTSEPAWKFRVHFEHETYEGLWVEYMARPEFLITE